MTWQLPKPQVIDSTMGIARVLLCGAEGRASILPEYLVSTFTEWFAASWHRLTMLQGETSGILPYGTLIDKARAVKRCER